MKGSIELAGMAVLSFLLALGLIGFTTDSQNYLETRFRKETTDIIANRVAGDIYAIDSYPRGGQVEVRLGDEYSYSIEDRQVNISYKGVWSTSNFSSGYPVRAEGEGTSTGRICITKRENEILVRGEGC